MNNAEKLRKKQEERVVALLKDRQFKRIPLNLLKTPSVIEIDSDANLDEMDIEIHAHGLISPISVCGPYPNGDYKVVEGARRIKALRRFLTSDEIPCYIVDGDVPTARIRELALAANMVHRENDTSLNLVYSQLVFNDYLNGKIEEKEMSATLAGLSGICKRQARKYIRIITDGYDALLNSVSDESLQVGEACAIVQAYPDNEAMQDRLIEVCKATPSPAKTAVIQEINAGRGECLVDGDVKKNIEAVAAKKQMAKQLKTAEECLEAIIGNPDILSDVRYVHIRELCAKVCAL